MVSKSLDGVLIKKPHQKVRWTEEQIIDFKECADPKTGPGHFMSKFFHIQHPVEGKMLYQPYKFQDTLVQSYHTYRFSINLLSRQMGKTTTAAGYLLWYAMFVPDSTILIAAHKYAGAQEIMQKIRYAYELMPDHIRAGVTSYNKGSIEFENGSRIVAQATTENTGRGMSITLLYCDEFAFVRPTIAREFWTSISPTLATGGKAIITSTPNSDEDQFWLLWTEANKTIDEYGNPLKGGVGQNGFHGFKALWQEHPDRDEQWAKDELGRIGDERFKREMDCEPIIFDETLINGTRLAEMEALDPINRQGQVRWFRKPKKGSIYLISLDPSLGTGGDNAAIQVIEMPSLEQVAEFMHNKTPIAAQIKILKEIGEYIVQCIDEPNNIYYSVENNTLGEAALVTIQDIGEENIPGFFLSEPKAHGNSKRFRKGFNTTHKSKISACAKLKALIETKRLKINSRNLISELKSFVAVGSSYQARPGETDDLVMSMVLAVRMSMLLKRYDAGIDELLRDDLDEIVEPMPTLLV